ncbi:DUF6531 domain-containing protein [Streptomyces sp. NPDC058471]|uniref:DUF6531 domain-containing protein n=1 Tax=Streptomyces sp. NPDC058471 TaxID=3346516 RepID=UPI003659599E
MAGNRPADWHVLDLDKDPTPGDPDRVRNLAKNLHDFADDVSKVLRDIKGMAGEDAILTWAGKTAESFTSEFEDAPGKLKKLKKSYEMAGDALSAYWPELERSQALADKALAKGREAQTSLSAAQTRLTSADSWVDRAGKEADKYKDDKDSGASKDVPKPDPDKVKAATRNANSAEKAQTAAKSDVTAAQSSLDAAKKMAEDARKMREDAAGTAKKKLEDASDAGIQNRKWWEEVGDWVTDNWDTIVAVCKVVVAVLGIIAMIIGGPILAAIVVVAALVVLADTLNKYAKGEAGLLDVAFAALDCIPGMKGITSAAKLAKGMKALGKGGLKAMRKGLRNGLRKGADDAVENGRPPENRCLGGDPIDMVSGEMLMEQTDVELPGLLPLILRRTHLSTYEWGRWFGPSWASTLDERLELDAEGAVFATEDGMLLAYPVPVPGSPVLPAEGPRWPLEWDGTPGDSIRITDPSTGHTRYFAPAEEGGAAPHGALALPLVARSDRNGHRIDIDRDRRGTPTAVRHSGGYHVHVDTEGDRVTQLRLRDPEAGAEGTRLLRYGYGGEGDLTEVYNSSGLPFRFTYDDRRRITSRTDRNGSWYRFTYDDQDRCIRGEGADHVLSCTIVYDTEDRETHYTDSLGRTTVHRYNDLLQRTEVIDAAGKAVRTEWDRQGRMVSRTDPLSRVTTFEHDARGNLRTLTRPDGNRIAMEYNELDLPVHVVAADGAEWRQSYDERGNRVSVTDPADNVRLYTYDDAGRPTSVVDPLGNVTAVCCDPAGLSVAETNALGATTEVERDAFGRIVRLVNAEGGVERMGWTVEGAPAWRVTADGCRETWEWDGEGNLVAHTDRAGHRSTVWTGHFHQPAARTDRTGAEFRFAYDTEVNLTRVTNPQGLTWDYTYDEVNRLVSETDFEGRTVSYAYDDAGQLVSRVNGAGDRLELTLDVMGRVVGQHTAQGVSGGMGANPAGQDEFAYDAAGRLVRAANDAMVLERAYDLAGRLVSETIDGAETTFAYDAVGRRTRRRTPGGIVSTWTYDAVGRPAELDAAGNSVSFVFDALGREVVRGLGAATTLTQAWDETGRLTGQTLRVGEASDVLVQDRAYSYRPDGLLSAISELTTGNRAFDMDAAGQVTGVRAVGWTEGYAYDTAGNIRESTTPTDGERPVDREYKGNRLLRSGRTRYEYDRQGRPVRTVKRLLNGQKRVTTYAWDAQDRLKATVTPDGAEWHYQYDPTGRRCGKSRLTSDGSVAEEFRFTWDGNRVAEQTTHDGRTTTWDYFSGTYRPLTQLDQRGEDVRFHSVVTDTVGTPTELVDNEGRLAWHLRTDLWGRDVPTAPDVVAPEAAVDCPLRFPGQYADAETGWNYNYARHYDPANARYVTPDPLGLGPQPNHYRYVAHPLAFHDPLGLARNPATGRYAPDPNRPDTRHNRSSEYPHGYWPETHEDMVTRFTDEGRAAGGWPLNASGERIPRNELTWRNNADEIIPSDVLTYDHNPRVVEHWNQTGHDSDYATREAWYNDTTDMEPMTRADNGRDGQRAPRYRQDTGPNYSCRGA